MPESARFLKGDYTWIIDSNRHAIQPLNGRLGMLMPKVAFWHLSFVSAGDPLNPLLRNGNRKGKFAKWRAAS